MYSEGMRLMGLSKLGLFLITALLVRAAALPDCSTGARAFSACELSFEWKTGELPPETVPYKNEILHVEFRSPQHKTYLIRDYWTGGQAVRVRFTPTEPGAWTYHVTGAIKRYNDKEATFAVAESGSPGFISVANVRHWRTMNKQPHLWMAAAVPFLALDQAALESWLDARKHDGFTHIRGTLLTMGAKQKPLSGDLPNEAYFQDLDDKILAAASRGFTLDLILADDSFVKTGFLNDYDKRGQLIRYLVARYGGLNVTWQGIEHFEDVVGSRELLKGIGEELKQDDTYDHPRSTDARDTSSPLLADGWMDYLIEASPHPELAAVEHQFTEAPEIHIVRATAPDDFRHELWNCTTNGEYPSVSYEALQNPANVKALQVWHRVISDTRHWEFEPYFDVDGARAVGLMEVGFIAYAQTPGILEITLERHKYNPVWVNPIDGEEIPLKDYRGEVLSRPTPDTSHDWILDCEREGHKEAMARSVRFESEDPPVQEPELDSAKIPFQIVDPAGNELNSAIPQVFSLKLTRANRATRSMQYVWWGEIVAGGGGARVLGIGPSGTFSIPSSLIKQPSANLNIRLLAINANGKAYEVDRVYRLTP
ncbi:MAG: DUF5060 domain-containing protein [Acidobacteriota bacterium]|nr:DUF5060 domain-containing protein [Acidobacteriota bacterium]